MEKLSSELEESIKSLDRLEKQQTEFNKFVDDTQKLLNQLQQSSLIQSLCHYEINLYFILHSISNRWEFETWAYK